MKTREFTRRDFLRGAGLIGLGSSFFFLVLQRESRRWAGTRFHKSVASLGTLVNVTIFDTPEAVAEQAVARAFREIQDVQLLMSTHDAGSQLSLVNRCSGSDFVQVDSRIIEVVQRGIEFSRQSGGVFDVTVLPLLEAWGFRNYRFDRPPDEARILGALDTVGYEQIVISEAGLGLKRKGAGIDLGGIAAGYAVDRAVASLRESGIRRFIVEAGGDLFAAGTPPDRESWEIGVKHPLRPGLCAVLQMANQAVATSANTESYVNYGGKHYGHLMNPRTGEPVDPYLSTTAVAPTTLEADAASTTLFVAGRNAGGSLAGPNAGWLHISQEGSGRLIFETSRNFPSWRQV